MPDATDPWVLLGIPRGSSLLELRRAYGRLLKQIDQHTDPQSFLALRAAFDQAKREIERAAPNDLMGGGSAPLPSTTSPPPLLPPLVVPEHSASRLIAEALSQRQLVEAATIFKESLHAHHLSLDEENAFSVAIAEQLQNWALHDQTVLETVSALMNWEAAGRMVDADPAIVAIIVHRDAGRWLRELQGAAQTPLEYGLGWSARQRAARTMLKPPPTWLDRTVAYFFPGFGLDYWVEGAARHRVLLSTRLHKARVEWCTRHVRTRRSRIVRIIFMTIFAAFRLVHKG